MGNTIKENPLERGCGKHKNALMQRAREQGKFGFCATQHERRVWRLRWPNTSQKQLWDGFYKKGSHLLLSCQHFGTSVLMFYSSGSNLFRSNVTIETRQSHSIPDPYLFMYFLPQNPHYHPTTKKKLIHAAKCFKLKA